MYLILSDNFVKKLIIYFISDKKYESIDTYFYKRWLRVIVGMGLIGVSKKIIFHKHTDVTSH